MLSGSSRMQVLQVSYCEADTEKETSSYHRGSLLGSALYQRTYKGERHRISREGSWAAIKSQQRLPLQNSESGMALQNWARWPISTCIHQLLDTDCSQDKGMKDMILDGAALFSPKQSLKGRECFHVNLGGVTPECCTRIPWTISGVLVLCSQPAGMP